MRVIRNRPPFAVDTSDARDARVSLLCLVLRRSPRKFPPPNLTIHKPPKSPYLIRKSVDCCLVQKEPRPPTQRFRTVYPSPVPFGRGAVHFPARDIATCETLRQSIRCRRKDKNARASLGGRQKEPRVLLELLQRLGDPVQLPATPRSRRCGRLLRGAIPIPLIKTRPCFHNSTTEGRAA